MPMSSSPTKYANMRYASTWLLISLHRTDVDVELLG